MTFGPRFRRILANPARLALAPLLALASAACEDPGLEPEPKPQEQLLFLSTRDGATGQSGPLTEIYRMNADGTGAENLTRQPANYYHLSVSPDRRRVLFARVPGCDIWVMNVDGTGQSRLTSSGTEKDDCNAWPRWSPNGTQIAFTTEREGRASGTTHGLYDVYVMNADGSNPHNVSHAANAELGAHDLGVVGWTPAGEVVFQARGVVNRVPFARVFVVKSDGTGLRPLFAGSTDHSPAWSPDGSKVVFMREKDGATYLYTMNADGTGERRLTTQASWEHLPGIYGGGSGTYHDHSPWSPDGKHIAFLSNSQIYVVNADGSGLRRLTEQFAAFNGWSPDGTRIAFTGNAAGHMDVYAVPFAGGEPVRLTTSASADSDALWTLK